MEAFPQRPLRAATPRLGWSELVASTVGLGLDRLDVDVDLRGRRVEGQQLVVQVYAPPTGGGMAGLSAYARPLAATCRLLDEAEASQRVSLRAPHLPNGAVVVAWLETDAHGGREFGGLECRPPAGDDFSVCRAAGGRATLRLGRARRQAA